jgi:ribosomal-protein-serine acetyltransferase
MGAFAPQLLYSFWGVLPMNPMLLDFPTEFYTERLFIRMPQPGDGKAVFQAIHASIHEFKSWLPFANEELSEDTIETNIRQAHAQFLMRKDLRLLIFLKDSKQFVGSSGLHNPNWSIPKFEIGYWLDTRFCGNGYMTEAVSGITQFAFDSLHARRLEIRCDTLNVRSKAIAERVGYTLEGTFKNDDISADGMGLRDTYIFAKVR